MGDGGNLNPEKVFLFNMGLIYTTIQHKFRKANKLTCNEYVLADMIYCLSTSPEAKIKGWCYMTKQMMADELGLTKQSILNLIDSLISKGFIERDPETSFLKTNRSWNIVYFTDGKESLPLANKESLPNISKENIPNKNTFNNNKRDNNIGVLFGDSEVRIGRKKFIVPTLEEIQLIIKDKKTAQKFLNHYNGNGWVIGKTKMVNWQATANNWKLDNEEKNKPEETSKRSLTF